MNRDRQRDCIYQIYQNKKIHSLESFDKAVFRGMVIPSLRYLGLIIGFSDTIRLSSNGKIMIESLKINAELHKRVICAIFLKIDQEIFHFVEKINKNQFLNKNEIFKLLSTDLKGPSEKQNYERMKKWITILKETGLIIETPEKISIDFENYNKSLNDLDVKKIQERTFKNYLFESYWNFDEDKSGIVDISKLRTSVALKYLERNNQIITENKFDDLLREVPLSSDNYIISLGRSMGAEEKLYKSKDNYFKTIHIKFLKGGEKNG